MQIRTIRKGFEGFKCKFERFKRDSKGSNAISNHSKGIRGIRVQIRTVRKGFEAFEFKFEPFERIQMQIRAIQKGFEGFKCNF